MTLPEYQYHRMDLATDAIRLIRIVKGNYDSLIRCVIFESYLDREIGVPYEALSYTWGDLSATQVPVEITDENSTTATYLHIYPNLCQILRHLRYDNEDRIMWVDAICIDQSPTHRALLERTHQVGQMRLVYKNADRVVAWLGNVDRDMNLLMEFAQQLDRKVTANSMNTPAVGLVKLQFDLLILSYEARGPQHFHKIPRFASAMSRVLEQPWFKRTWIIQEVASARSGLLACSCEGATISVPMRTFALLPSLMELKTPPHSQVILDVMPRVGQRREGWWNKKHDLITLLAKFSDRECTDPRDSVYALLGICSDLEATRILRADYEAPLGLVWRNTLSYVLFHEIVDPETYKLPHKPIWNLFPSHYDGPDIKLKVLSWALEGGSDNVALRLLDLKNMPWEQDFEMTLPGLATVFSCCPEIHTADYVERCFGAHLLLQFARDQNDLDGVSRILTKGYLDLSCQIFEWKDLLFTAINAGRVEIVKCLLLYKDTNANVLSTSGKTPLCMALHKLDYAMVQTLLQRKDTNVNFPEPTNQHTPLYIALQLEMWGAVELIVQHESCDPTARDILSSITH